MKKILSLLVCVCLLLSAMVITASAADSTASYVKVTEAPADWSGDYLIVYENGANSRVLNGGLDKLDAEGNYITAAIVDNKIEATDATNAAKFTIEKNGSAYAIKSASGKYIGNSKDQNKLLTDKKYDNTLTLQADGSVDIVSANSHLRSNIETNNGNRFRYYKSSTYTKQKAVALYKLETVTGGDEPSCEHTAKSAVPNGDETHKVVCDACGETVTASVDCTDADVNGKCDVCTGDVTVPFDPTDKTAAEIVDAAYALTGSETIENVTLKGKIVKVDYAYNAEYGNITVTIAVEGADAEKTIQCFRMTGENIADLTYDDVITVTGTIKNYNGTIEFDKPVCTAVEKAKVEENNDPAADSVLTIKEALELGASKKHNMYTENKYYVTGKITSFSGDRGKEFGNIIIADDEGNEILIYGTYDATGEIRYDALENPPVEGDTVTVYGIIGQFNGTAQMKNGWYKDAPVVEEDKDDTTTDDGKDDTAGGTAGGTTGGSTTGSTTTTTPEVKPNTDNSTTSPATGDNVGAFAVMAIAAAAVVIAASKKRA